MVRRRKREEIVKPSLVQGFAHGMSSIHEIEVPLIAFERPPEPQDGANASKVNEVQLVQVDRHGFGLGKETLMDRSGEVASIGCVHPALGPGDQALPLF
jgi:hypothetical protein